MARPRYCLCINKDTNIEEFNKLKEKYISAGFNVIVLNNTSDDNDFELGLLNIIKNHIK